MHELPTPYLQQLVEAFDRASQPEVLLEIDAAARFIFNHTPEASMDTPLPPTLERLQQLLTQADYTYWYVSVSGDTLLIPMGPEPLGQGEVTVFISLEGPNRDILAIRMESGRPIPSGEVMGVLLDINAWNLARRWPKAFLSSQDLTGATGVRVVLEAQFPLEAGVHDALLKDLIVTILGTGLGFWAWCLDRRQAA